MVTDISHQVPHSPVFGKLFDCSALDPSLQMLLRKVLISITIDFYYQICSSRLKISSSIETDNSLRERPSE